MVFKNKNAFTLALSLIIAPSSLVQASESLITTLTGEVENDETHDSTPITLPLQPNSTVILRSDPILIPVAGEPTPSKDKTPKLLIGDIRKSMLETMEANEKLKGK